MRQTARHGFAMSRAPQVAVAMSGGVDSSVAAALLVERGYRVVGLMLRLWSEPGRASENRCCTPAGIALAQRVAARLAIPFHVIDAQEPFSEAILTTFVSEYRRGRTPNPCLVCNREIRWGYLRRHAQAMGAELLATGHYARTREREGQFDLLTARDSEKDQSYVLSVLDQEALQHSLFPVGDLTKQEVREQARRLELPVADRPDSQDLCFLAGDDYRDFLRRQAPDVFRAGAIVTTDGRRLGTHEGLAAYTIGQRKGLGVQGAEPLYVVDLDEHSNQVVVGPRHRLGRRALVTERAHWINPPAPTAQIQAQVKIRYKAPAAPARVTPLGDGMCRVEFENPLRDITPGQAAVFYQGEYCLGQATIAQSLSEGD
jgi:tRNA-specific 2-thiouridylase